MNVIRINKEQILNHKEVKRKGVSTTAIDLEIKPEELISNRDCVILPDQTDLVMVAKVYFTRFDSRLQPQHGGIIIRVMPIKNDSKIEITW